jgi:hypothetical protein
MNFLAVAVGLSQNFIRKPIDRTLSALTSS